MFKALSVPVTRETRAFPASMNACLARADVMAVGSCGCLPCRHEMEAVWPILIVAPATMLPFWEGETALWMGDDANVIVYAGSLSARNMMHDHELWLSPGSLDGKSATHKTREVRKICPRSSSCTTSTKTSQARYVWRSHRPIRSAWVVIIVLKDASFDRCDLQIPQLFIVFRRNDRSPNRHPVDPLQALPLRVPKPDVVITSYEAASSDAAALKAVTWEVILLDERQRGRIGIAKVQAKFGTTEHRAVS